jgi:hypothetical protein
MKTQAKPRSNTRTPIRKPLAWKLSVETRRPRKARLPTGCDCGSCGSCK